MPVVPKICPLMQRDYCQRENCAIWHHDRCGLIVDGVFIAEPISNAVGGIASFTTMMLTVWRKLGKMETQSLPAAEAEETTGENVPAAP